MFHMYNMNILSYDGKYEAVRKCINPYIILWGITASLYLNLGANLPWV